MNTDGNEKDGDETEIDDGMNHNGSPTGLHVPKLNHSSPPGNLKEEARAQQHEEHHSYHHGPPIRHISSNYREEKRREETGLEVFGYEVRGRVLLEDTEGRSLS